ncbi:helix-turn-helix domain-containing protein [Pseudomonas sp. NPDC077649]|uniref:helix-turn-helix domain-containing protein n=1 Tax=Pseudomonas sp. NPDC077649 TaxID=3364423 RepID=UPI0037C89DA8
MSLEGQLLDRKSLRSVTGKTADWPELAKDCVAFANALGGRLLIGIVDGDVLPPAEQRVPANFPGVLCCGLRSMQGHLVEENAVRMDGK